MTVIVASEVHDGEDEVVGIVERAADFIAGYGGRRCPHVLIKFPMAAQEGLAPCPSAASGGPMLRDAATPCEERHQDHYH